MTEPVFDAQARTALAALYPEIAGRIRHGLVGHPLFEFEALVRLAQRIAPADVEHNLADLPVGIDNTSFQVVPTYRIRSGFSYRF